MVGLSYKNSSKTDVKFFLISVITLFSIGCDHQASSQNAPPREKNYESLIFKKYWYSGLAEISTFQLQQWRYGEARSGKSVLIFVTEDFSNRKQVKLDRPENAAEDKVGVLKLNYTKNFVTGIYPYSLMLSTFTPIEVSRSPKTLKVAMSGQEWCGQVYSQLNLRNQKYQLVSHSYFEDEGDREESFPSVLLEDELFNRIRLNPEELPTGKFQLLPGLFFSRLTHVPLAVENVVATKSLQGNEVAYRVEFPTKNRLLTIRFEKNFPYKILGWEEEFMERGKKVRTTATLHKTIRTDYWTKNKNEHLHLRDSLGLSHSNY